MKFNVRKDECEEEKKDFLIPHTICIQADQEELRRLIRFANYCIELMDQYEDFNHRHLQDFENNGKDYPDIVITHSEKKDGLFRKKKEKRETN